MDVPGNMGLIIPGTMTGTLILKTVTIFPQNGKSRTELIAVHHGKTGFKATPSKNKDCQHVGRKRGI